MHKQKCTVTLGIVPFLFCVLAVQTHAQETVKVEGYDVIAEAYGSSICFGGVRQEGGTFGQPVRIVCLGQKVPAAAYAAIQAKFMADRLEQIRVLLDQKMATNEKLGQLVDATSKTQSLMEQQLKQSNELLHDTIVKRFDALPAELLTNPLVKQEIQKLKEEILKEVDKRIPKSPTP